jgi:hypothetical protein
MHSASAISRYFVLRSAGFNDKVFHSRLELRVIEIYFIGIRAVMPVEKKQVNYFPAC